MDTHDADDENQPIHATRAPGAFDGLVAHVVPSVNALTRLLRDSPAELLLPLFSFSAATAIAWRMKDAVSTTAAIGMACVSCFVLVTGAYSTYLAHKSKL